MRAESAIRNSYNYIGFNCLKLSLERFELAIPFLPSADVLPSCGNSELATANQGQSSVVGGPWRITTHADDWVHGQENSTDSPSKFNVEWERLREHASTPLPNRQKLGADGCQQEPRVLSHPDRSPEQMRLTVMSHASFVSAR